MSWQPAFPLAKGRKEISIYLPQIWFFQSRTHLCFSQRWPISLSPTFLLYGRPLVNFSVNLTYCMWTHTLSWNTGEFLVLIQTEKQTGNFAVPFKSLLKCFGVYLPFYLQQNIRLEWLKMKLLVFFTYICLSLSTSSTKNSLIFLVVGIETFLPPFSQELRCLQLMTDRITGL